MGFTYRISSIAPAIRSIPTCVGFTVEHNASKVRHGGPSPRAWGLRMSPVVHTRSPPVHPHVRGVYADHPGQQRHPERSIPTCVGFTHWARRRGRWRAVHPHVRGVYDMADLVSQLGTGPSPRAWGLRLCWWRRRKQYRSIPTCVGFTTSK